MSIRSISNIQEEWGLSDELTEAVVDEIDWNTSLDVKKNYRLSKQGLDDLEPEVDEGRFMKALRSLDGRTWHDREVDYLTQAYIDQVVEGGYNMLLRDVDIAHSDYNFNGRRPDKRGKTNLKERGLPIVDIDFALVSLDEDNVSGEYWDVKTMEKDLESSDLDAKIKRISGNLETDGYFVDLTRNRLVASDLPSKMQEIGENPLPHKYSGDYLISGGLDQGNPEVSKFVERFMGYGSLGELDEVKKEEDSGNFFS